MNLSGGNATVVLTGTAGNQYSIVRATNPQFTTGTRTFPATVAPAGGAITNSDDFSDLGSVPPAAYYRLLTVP